jgi:hypothetical protein
MTVTALKFGEFVNDMYESKGKKYTIWIPSQYDEYATKISGGIIADSFIENDTIYIILTHGGIEHFTIPSLKEITFDGIAYKVTYPDNSYFMITVKEVK